MDKLIIRLYLRLGIGILGVMWLVLLVFITGTGLIGLLVFKRLENVPGHEFWPVVGAIFGVEVITFAAAFWFIMRRHRVVIDWIRDGPSPEHAVEMWTSGMTLPADLARIGLLFIGPPVFACFLIGGTSMADTSFTTMAWLALMTISILVYVVAWVSLVFAITVRLSVRDASRLLPEDFEMPPVRKTARSMYAALVAMTFSSGVVVAGFAAERGSGLEEGMRIYLLGAAAALVFGLPLAALFTERILGSTRVMRRGTAAVAAGDFSVRVPVISDDEQGQLQWSFNTMVSELARTTEELRASRARIVAVGDAERRRLERDIHDGAQQRLVMLQLKLTRAERRFADDPEASELIEGLREEVRGALDELRDLAHGIYPAVLETDGLPGALEEAAQRAAIPTTVEAGDTRRYPPELEAAVYFCCLEALQNAGKYAGEDARARVELASRNGKLEFTVRDDGAGFDASAIEATHGLQNMTDRIGALGGTLTVESVPGGGTRVSGSVPATRAEEADAGADR